MWLDLGEQPGAFHISHDLLACIKAVHTTIGLWRIVVDGGIDRENIDHFQVVALANFIVIKIVGGRDFYAASTKLRIDVIIRNNWYASIAKGQVYPFADQ